MTVFKIMDVAGRFSLGGSDPRFSKLGKIWNTWDHLEAHLRLLMEPGGAGLGIYRNCVIVEYELVCVGERAVGDVEVGL